MMYVLLGMMKMYHIKYTAENAQKDMNDYNHSLDKSLKIAEQCIQGAAKQGYSRCSLRDPLDETEHWIDVKKELIKVGYKVDVDFVDRWFNVYW